MNQIKKDIKDGITIHKINTNKFKTNLFAIFLAVPLRRDDVTKNALITAILRRGSKNNPTQDIISKRLEEMYGATFDCGIEKTGDNHILKFYLETINEEFLPEKGLTKNSIDILLDIVFNPLLENGGFKQEYFDSEKNNLKQIIESKIDNKRVYSFERCIEEMYKNEPYGLYKYGYVEDLEKINSKDLYEYFKKLIGSAKIDIYASGDFKDDSIIKIIEENEKIKNLKEREAEYIENTEKSNKIEVKDTKTIEEHMQVVQGNLVLGLNINTDMKNAKFITSVYNAILGGGANSKLFQNVREKQSLAYTAGSTYRRQKNVIFIRCGIEIANYEKALNTIKEQLQDIANGNFSEEDVNNAKKLISESIVSIPAEQDTEITYYYGQELSDTFVSIEEYIKNINEVTKEEIVKLAKDISINTIYFLRD